MGVVTPVKSRTEVVLPENLREGYGGILLLKPAQILLKTEDSQRGDRD